MEKELGLGFERGHRFERGDRTLMPFTAFFFFFHPAF